MFRERGGSAVFALELDRLHRTVDHLVNVVSPPDSESFTRHYHEECNHQGLDNQIIEPGDEVGQNTGEIECCERLGGILRYYYRRAA